MLGFLLVNEVEPGSDPTQDAGAIYVLESAKAAENYFEPWYVDERYLLLGDDGMRRVFVLADKKLVVTVSDDLLDYSKWLRRLLIGYLKSVEQAIHAKKNRDKIEPIEFDQLSTETLFKLALLFS